MSPRPVSSNRRTNRSGSEDANKVGSSSHHASEADLPEDGDYAPEALAAFLFASLYRGRANVPFLVEELVRVIDRVRRDLNQASEFLQRHGVPEALKADLEKQIPAVETALAGIGEVLRDHAFQDDQWIDDSIEGEVNDKREILCIYHQCLVEALNAIRDWTGPPPLPLPDPRPSYRIPEIRMEAPTAYQTPATLTEIMQGLSMIDVPVDAFVAFTPPGMGPSGVVPHAISPTPGGGNCTPTTKAADGLSSLQDEHVGDSTTQNSSGHGAQDLQSHVLETSLASSIDMSPDDDVSESSDSMDTDSEEEALKPIGNMRLKLEREIISRVMFQVRAVLGTQNADSQESGEGSSGESTKTNERAPVSAVGHTPNHTRGLKRPVGDQTPDNGDGDDGDKREKRPRSSKSPGGDQVFSGLRFGCPFYKRDPANHQKWPSCSGRSGGFISVHRTK
jgi:hypothetical protein